MNSNETPAAYWGASSNTNEHADWGPHLNPITWLHCSGQVGCYYLQTSICGRAGVCRVAIMHSLWYYDSHWLKQLSCVVILIYILAIASHIIKLYCFILPCPPLHLSKGFTCIELRVLKEKTNWSFSYCYFWSPPDLERKMKLLQSPGWSVCIQTFHGIPTVSSILPQTQEVLYK